MATVSVIKVSVKEVQSDRYEITLNMKYLDGTTELINRDFTATYYRGQLPSTVISSLKGAMQEAIDIYKREQIISNSATLNTAITNLQGSLQV